MFQFVIETAIRFRWLVVFLAAAIAAYGLFELNRLPIDAVPDITNRQVQISTVAPALAPEQIERLVTYPLETALAGITGLTSTRSLSRNGFSQVTAVFTDQTDIYFARQQVAERMRDVEEDLPEGAVPVMSPVTTGLGEVLMWTVDYTPFDADNAAAPASPAGRRTVPTSRPRASGWPRTGNALLTCVPCRTGSSRRRCALRRDWRASIRSGATSRNTPCGPIPSGLPPMGSA